jgi:hypothetical protein
MMALLYFGAETVSHPLRFTAVRFACVNEILSQFHFLPARPKKPLPSCSYKQLCAVDKRASEQEKEAQDGLG